MSSLFYKGVKKINYIIYGNHVPYINTTKYLLSLNFQSILELVYFETLNQFSFSYFKIREFNFFNQILLYLFYVSYVFRILKLYLNFLYCLTHFCFNIKSNIIMKHI